jgi:hypothetical protein
MAAHDIFLTFIQHLSVYIMQLYTQDYSNNALTHSYRYNSLHIKDSSDPIKKLKFNWK